jgi:uncharacterized protein YcgI (DUF1989 family)
MSTGPGTFMRATSDGGLAASGGGLAASGGAELDVSSGGAELGRADGAETGGAAAETGGAAAETGGAAAETGGAGAECESSAGNGEDFDRSFTLGEVGGAAGTDSTVGARSHARAQALGATMRIPATPADVDASRLVWAESIPADGYATRVLGRGTRVRLIDVDGGACTHMMLYRAEAPWERLNVADTIKVPWQAYLGSGHPLLSDQGRLLATLVADSSGHHDTLCGPTASGRGLLLLGAIKHGLDIRDVAPSVSFFRGVRVDSEGALQFSGSAGAGAAVDLLVHLPVIVVLANAAHPLDPCPHVTGLDVLAWRAGGELSTPVNNDPEYLRALFNTETAWAAATSTGEVTT